MGYCRSVSVCMAEILSFSYKSGRDICCGELDAESVLSIRGFSAICWSALAVQVLLMPRHLNPFQLPFVRKLRIARKPRQLRHVLMQIRKTHRQRIQSRMRLGQLNSNLLGVVPIERDRKSTRLNSSHDDISYAVFCLKNKTTDRFRGQVEHADLKLYPNQVVNARL